MLLSVLHSFPNTVLGACEGSIDVLEGAVLLRPPSVYDRADCGKCEQVARPVAVSLRREMAWTLP